MTHSGPLNRLAELAGIEPDYWDIWGNHHVVSDKSKRSLLAALDIPVNSDAAITTSIRTLEEEPWCRPLPPVHICLEGRALRIPLSLFAADAAITVRGEVVAEGGARHPFAVRPSDAPASESRVIGGVRFERRLIELPVSLPLGYHDLSLEEPMEAAMRLIVAPERCYLPRSLAEGGRQWGITAHLYTLRSKRDWGIGDFAHLDELVKLSSTLGATLIGLNPLHALFLQRPQKASPYFPSSRLFLNPIYLDIEGNADFAECAEAQEAASALARTLTAIRGADLIDYPAVVTIKGQILRLLFDWFRRHHLEKGERDARALAFTAFCREGGESLHRFAVFEALSERFDGASWQKWPKDYHRPDLPAVEEFARSRRERVEFHKYLQWQANVQLAEIQKNAQGSGVSIGLYRDLAVGAAPDGADGWCEQDVIVQKASVGAPPDPFNMLGQDWGTPPLNPHVLRHKAYEPFVAIVRANMRHAGALRIDHVMGLMHLFWMPAGELPATGAYLKYPFEDLLAILALESQRNRCLVIGEDLGTVPDGFRERMAAANVLSYRVLYFEKDGDRFKRPNEYPNLSLACVSTHDLATVVGFWKGADIDLKHGLKLYPSAEAEQNERAGRRHDRQLLLGALAAEGLLPRGTNPQDPDSATMGPELTAAIHHYLARSPAKLMMVQIDDLTEAVEQINLPGTDQERPNWRRRLPMTIDELASSPVARVLQDSLSARQPTAA